MTIPDDPDQLKTWMMERWHEYGERFSVFEPADQPAPSVWEPQLPEPDHLGREHPDSLKHWRRLHETRELLRDRYGRHGILQGASLSFDCLVPKFQKHITDVWGQDAHGNPEAFPVQDRHEWYEGAIRMGIFVWQVGFSCRSVACQREWCRLHIRNPDRINPIDIYSLLQVFEGFGTAKALSVVSAWFGVKIRPFDHKGVRDTSVPRRRVPKAAVHALLSKYRTMRTQHVHSFMDEAATLVRSSPVVPWHRRLFDADHAFLSEKVIKNLSRIASPAIKAYLWLLLHQEEEARQNRFEMKVSDADLARALGVSRDTAMNHRRELEKLGFVESVKVNRGVIIRKAKY